MKTYENQLLLKRILKIAGVTAAVYLSVRFILPLVIPFFVALGLAALLNKAVDKIAKNKPECRKAVCMLVFFGFLAVVATAGIFLAYELFSQIKEVCLHYQTWWRKIECCWGNCCDRMEEISGIKAERINILVQNKAEDLWNQGKNKVMTCVFQGSVNGAKHVLKISWVVLVTSISTLLFLLDYNSLMGGLKGSKAGEIAGKMLNRVKSAGGSYLKAQFLIMVCVSAICVIGLFLSGNPYALLAGIAIGICDALPFLGTGTVFIPWIIIEVVQGKYGYAVLYLVIYISCSMLRELLEPRLVGKSIGVHPVCVLISIYIGIRVYGGAGVLLGPLSAFLIWEILKITDGENPDAQKEEDKTEEKKK